MIRPLATALLLAAALPAVAHAKPIERYKAPDPSAIILQGAELPAGSSILFLSGQVPSPLDPAKPMSSVTAADFGDTKTQTISVLTKMQQILEAHGYKMSDLVKLTVFVVGDPKLGGKMDFGGMNAGFKQFFGTADNPNTVARSAMQVVALAGPFQVEIEGIAAKAPAGK